MADSERQAKVSKGRVRIIVQTMNCGAAVNVAGAKAEITFQTFDVECPELEAYLREHVTFEGRQVIGGHPLDRPKEDRDV